MSRHAVKRGHPPGKTDAAGAPPRSTFLLVSCFVVLPLALCGSVVPLILFSLPIELIAVHLAGAAVFIAASWATGARHHQGRRSRPASVESFFWVLMLFALAGSGLIFFVLNLEWGRRVAAGAAEAAVFVITAGVYVVWARLSGRKSGGGARTRLSRVAFHTENALLILAAAWLFAWSFPGFLSADGCGALAFFSLLPVFIVIGRCGWLASAAFGAAYGFLAHALFNYWLATFNPVALTVVLSIRVLYYIALFLLLRSALRFFPRWGFLLQTVLWVGYEFLSAQGFIAYAYGILGYSQYLCAPLLQSASLAGVWGLSLLVVLPGAYLGNAFRRGPAQALMFFKRTIGAPVVYALVFAGALVYGCLSAPAAESLPRLKVASIQPNLDPWIGGDDGYEASLRILMRLSRQAEAAGPDLVVWPETALVPSLRYHTLIRDNPERYARVIRPFLDFMAERDVPYLIGNNDREAVGRTPDGGFISTSYNAALLLSRQEIQGVYRKTHLVPFTEHFPYKDILPGLYDWLSREDTHFYDAGGAADADQVFRLKDVSFSVLICFEDTFGEIARRFSQRGADLLINLTNDAWSKTEAAETQHLAIAVFRAVENRRSLLRCTTSGITAVIDPAGRISGRLPPFAETYQVYEVPINRPAPTLSMLWGDWCGLLSVGLAVLGLAAGLALAMVKRLKRRADSGAAILTKVGESKTIVGKTRNLR